MDFKMVRQLFFTAIAVLTMASTCSASFVIDDFAIERASSNDFTYSELLGGYFAELDAGETASLTYDFTDTPFNSDDLGQLAGDDTVTTLIFDSSIITVSGATQVTNLGLSVSGSNFGPVSTSVSESPTSVDIGSQLADTESLTFEFTNSTSSTQSFIFGAIGGTLEAASAVPEATSFLMFPVAMGLATARRRRRR